MKRQLLENQRGEIAFREKLYRQQVQGETIFEDEFDGRGIESILAERMNKTLHDMKAVRAKGAVLSPYIEIGAERCQRSLVMENDLEANGAAVDISHALLRSASHYQRVFQRGKSPLRICCDANHLPFMSGSVPFVFCYETLHHFPEPAPITNEVFRVLQPGGHFFFDEEPFRQVLHVGLYKAKKSYSKQYLGRSFTRKVCDRFFLARSCNETVHGILENNRISLKEWRRALAQFDASNVKLELGPIQSQFIPSGFNGKYLALWLLGGGVSGICRKPGQAAGSSRFISQLLICPSCMQLRSEVPLSRRDPDWECSSCSKRYPVIDNVLFLFAYDKFEELYPQISRSLRGEQAESISA